jgi:uncharacterized SAM-binding protein YcdF (DUF218 family)
MFIAAKLLDFVTQPLSWVVVLLTLGLLMRRRRPRTATGLQWAALAILVLLGWQPLPDLLIRQLESRHPAVPAQADLSRYAGLVVLGGALEPAYVWAGHGQPALNDGAERMTAALPLLQRYPHWRLLFTGGEGELTAQGMSEAERAQIFYQSMNVAPQRLLLEAASRTTHENAVFSAALPGVDKTRAWLLVTSAWHMPRALATFEKAGWNVTPYPVDFRTGVETPWLRYSLAEGAARWHLALHEYLGLLAYRVSGRL